MEYTKNTEKALIKQKQYGMKISLYPMMMTMTKSGTKLVL